MARRIIHDRCFGTLIDVQEYFLSEVDKGLRGKLKTNASHFVRLLGHFKIPLVVTLERPVARKGRLPKEIRKHLGERAQTFEKDFFDLAKDADIRAHIERLGKKQAILAGCETDVCVLQSCLGLLDLGYDVFLVEELLFLPRATPRLRSRACRPQAQRCSATRAFTTNWSRRWTAACTGNSD